MYITADLIMKAGGIIAAASTIIGAIIAVYKVIDRVKKQSKTIEEMQAEQLVICKGLRGALQGLIEKGCNGPCRDALSLLDEHLNKRAHNTDVK